MHRPVDGNNARMSGSRRSPVPVTCWCWRLICRCAVCANTREVDWIDM